MSEGGDDDFLADFYDEDGDDMFNKPDTATKVHAAIMSRASSFVTLEKHQSNVAAEKEIV